MKNLIITIILAVCAIAVAGCGKKAVEIPTFKSANVNAYLKDYAAYGESANEIYSTPEKFSQLPAKMNEFAKRQAQIVKELQGESEVNAFNKCITQIRATLEKVRAETRKQKGFENVPDMPMFMDPL